MSSEGFFEQVYKVVEKIPHGRVTSYGAIAKYLGGAMNASKKAEVPAHRVVNRNGLLSGKHHFKGTHLMQQLLESEGVVVKENQVQQFDVLFWDPRKEL